MDKEESSAKPGGKYLTIQGWTKITFSGCVNMSCLIFTEPGTVILVQPCKKQAAKVMTKCRGNGSSLPAPLLKFAEMKIAEDREKGNNFAGKTERGREWSRTLDPKTHPQSDGECGGRGANLRGTAARSFLRNCRTFPKHNNMNERGREKAMFLAQSFGELYTPTNVLLK